MGMINKRPKRSDKRLIARKRSWLDSVPEIIKYEQETIKKIIAMLKI